MKPLENVKMAKSSWVSNISHIKNLNQYCDPLRHAFKKN